MPAKKKRLTHIPIYEDDHIVAFSKPRGMLTVGNNPGQKNLLDIVKKPYQEQNTRLRPLHRLDRGTSGLVLFAKTKECFEQAVTEKKFSEATKTYLGLIQGVPLKRANTITFTLPSRQDKRKLLPARTKYKIKETYQFPGGKASLLEAKISSGRFHQIRRHLQKIHHPLLMDSEYMDKKDFKHFKKIMKFYQYLLHSHRIEVPHFITGENLVIEAPLPKEFSKTLKRLA
jgi:RluA family pseudouridine synthase